MSEAAADCLFCRIVAGQVPAQVLRRSARTWSLQDIAPQAPFHVLVVPTDHHRDIAALTSADPGLAGELLAEAVAVAQANELTQGGYRIVLNTGAQAGQTVFHVHAHVLGGRGFSWPPG